MSVKTDVAREFLRLLDTHFPKRHPYHKLFNRNNTKVSYCCMPNMAQIIKSHNAKILSPKPPTSERTCNCRKPEDCPLRKSCLQECIIYKATVDTPGKPPMDYIGLTEGTFKKRHYGHTSDFRASSQRKSTALSKYIWQLRDEGCDSSITWEIIKKPTPYRCGSRRCDLCLSEKAAIALSNPSTTLNKRSEIAGACRHQAKWRYERLKDGPT